jgi:uncharacterized protein
LEKRIILSREGSTSNKKKGSHIMRTHDQVAAMSCPVCRVPLTMSDRAGIEIDYCQQCRGVWLDRGELDKIIERSAASPAPQAAPQASPQPMQPQAPYPPQQQGYAHPGSSHYGYGHKPHKKKYKSWLDEIFD